MTDREFNEKVVSEIVPAILETIERFKVSAQQATEIPQYIETAIRQSNWNLLLEEPFRAWKDCLK